MEHIISLIDRIVNFYYPFFAYDIKVFTMFIHSWWNWVTLGIPMIAYFAFFIIKWIALWAPITIPLGGLRLFKIINKIKNSKG